MRRQPPIQSSRPISEVTPAPVRVARADSDDRAVLLDRAADGAELEIGPIATSRGARWTRAESLLGLGLVAILLGGAVINGITNPGPKPASSNTIVATIECKPIVDFPVTPAPASLRQVGETSGSLGRTGKASDRDLAEPDDWLLPRPNEGLSIGLGTPLEATSGEACVVGWSLWAVPTVDVLVNAEATMVRLGSGAFEPTAAPVPVPSPTANGDWTIRLATAYQTESNKKRWSVKFFRVQVGGAPYQTPVPPTPRPTPVPTPAITPAVACGPAPAATGPPTVFLVAPDQEPIAGTLGASTWFGDVTASSNIQLTEGPTVPFQGELELRISDDTCATRWGVASMPMPQGESSLNEAAFQGSSEWTSFSSNRADNPIIAQQNRITATPIGLGRIVVRALLWFEGGNQVQAYWLLRVNAFPAPRIRVVGPDGSAITPVVGCGVSVQTNENWYGEECLTGSWPILEDGPILTVHDGDVVTLESPEWALQSWNVSWADQASVADGGDPEYSGNANGSDILRPGVARWVAPSAGDWSLRFDLYHQDGEWYYSLPLHMRLRVLP